MKNIQVLFIALVLISTSVFAQSENQQKIDDKQSDEREAVVNKQSEKQRKADKLFNDFSFVKAISTYEKLIDTSFNQYHSMRKLGDAYIMLRKPEKALEIYKNVVKQKDVPSEYFLYYAQVLRANGEYKESKKWMKKYKDAGNSQDSRVKKFFKNDDFASAIFNSTEKHELERLKINTKYNDFGAVEFDDKIVFSSSRDVGVSVKRLYAWDRQPLLDLYEAPIKDGSGRNTKPIKGFINTVHHEGPATFNSEETKMYFSRNNYHNSKKYNDKDGIMHVGIYSAELEGSEWRNVKPINLNNPDYIVYHPSLNEDGTKLYFASDMPGGMGGTDIYVSELLEDGSFGTPLNMGETINTEGNEAFPFIHKGFGTLYFSSDGHPGLGLMDVFATVKNENDEIVNVINLGEPINSKKDDIGYYLNKNGYKGYVSSNRRGGAGGDDIYAFNRVPTLTLRGTIYDAVNNQPISGAKVVLGRRNGEELAYSITEKDGTYEHLIPRNQKFVLKGSKEKYHDVSRNFNSFGLENEDEIIVDLNVGMKPIEDVSILADLDIIYFDLDKYNIRLDAAIELNKVVNLMNRYPGMVIRLESHTDSRANDEYNYILSNNRARSTYEYLMSKGIAPERIAKFEGFGETQLVNRCSNGVKCTEVEHQLNRRTEFIILKMK